MCDDCGSVVRIQYLEQHKLTKRHLRIKEFNDSLSNIKYTFKLVWD